MVRIFVILSSFVLLSLVTSNAGSEVTPPSYGKEPVSVTVAAVSPELPVATKSAVKATSPRKQRKSRRAASLPLAKIEVSSKYGPRKHPVLKRRSFHDGVDLRAKLNDHVRAIFDGVVAHSGTRGALGNAVIVSHPKLNVMSIYGHLNKVAVTKGERIKAGTVIGYAGTTGRSTGVHLHLTVKDHTTGKTIEPVAFLSKLPGMWERKFDSTGAKERLAKTIPAITVKRSIVVTTNPRKQGIANKRPAVLQSDASTVKIAANVGNSDIDQSKLKLEKVRFALAKASSEAARLKQLYAEGILARNTYVDAEKRVQILRGELNDLSSAS